MDLTTSGRTIDEENIDNEEVTSAEYEVDPTSNRTPDNESLFDGKAELRFKGDKGDDADLPDPRCNTPKEESLVKVIAREGHKGLSSSSFAMVISAYFGHFRPKKDKENNLKSTLSDSITSDNEETKSSFKKRRLPDTSPIPVEVAAKLPYAEIRANDDMLENSFKALVVSGMFEVRSAVEAELHRGLILGIRDGKDILAKREASLKKQVTELEKGLENSNITAIAKGGSADIVGSAEEGEHDIAALSPRRETVSGSDGDGPLEQTQAREASMRNVSLSWGIAGQIKLWSLKLYGLDDDGRHVEVDRFLWCDVFRELLLDVTLREEVVRDIAWEKLAEEDERVVEGDIIPCGVVNHPGVFKFIKREKNDVTHISVEKRRLSSECDLLGKAASIKIKLLDKRQEWSISVKRLGKAEDCGSSSTGPNPISALDNTSLFDCVAYEQAELKQVV
ncbi:hypothetical protein GIB67_029582, partial [Kingdonia uniflora]